MKIITTLSVIVLFIASCMNNNVPVPENNLNHEVTDSNVHGPRVEIFYNYEVIGGDTVNRRDNNLKKQGIWYETDLDHDPYTDKVDTVIYKDGVIIEKNLRH